MLVGDSKTTGADDNIRWPSLIGLAGVVGLSGRTRARDHLLMVGSLGLHPVDGRVVDQFVSGYRVLLALDLAGAVVVVASTTAAALPVAIAFGKTLARCYPSS